MQKKWWYAHFKSRYTIRRLQQQSECSMRNCKICVNQWKSSSSSRDVELASVAKLKLDNEMSWPNPPHTKSLRKKEKKWNSCSKLMNIDVTISILRDGLGQSVFKTGYSNWNLGYCQQISSLTSLKLGILSGNIFN